MWWGQGWEPSDQQCPSGLFWGAQNLPGQTHLLRAVVGARAFHSPTQPSSQFGDNFYLRGKKRIMNLTLACVPVDIVWWVPCPSCKVELESMRARRGLDLMPASLSSQTSNCRLTLGTRDPAAGASPYALPPIAAALCLCCLHHHKGAC
jgi:hypothetical protein